MSTRRSVVVPDNATTIRETNRFLKLPFTEPTEDAHHATNMRELERWGNRIPYSSGGDCCSCWKVSSHDWSSSTSGSTSFDGIEAVPSTSPVVLNTSIAVENPAQLIAMTYQIGMVNEGSPGAYYEILWTLTGTATGLGIVTYAIDTHHIPLYAPSNTSGYTYVSGFYEMALVPFDDTSFDLDLTIQYYDGTGAATDPSASFFIGMDIWNKSDCFYFLYTPEE